MRNSVGNEGGGGRQRACLQIIVLIRVQRPRDKRISCKGQVARRGGEEGRQWAWDLAFTRFFHYHYGIVHGIQMGRRGSAVHCAIDLQTHCNSAGSVDMSGQ